MRADFEALGAAFPALTPPVRPVPLERVETLARRIAATLRSASAA